MPCGYGTGEQRRYQAPQCGVAPTRDYQAMTDDEVLAEARAKGFERMSADYWAVGWARGDDDHLLIGVMRGTTPVRADILARPLRQRAHNSERARELARNGGSARRGWPATQPGSERLHRVLDDCQAVRHLAEIGAETGDF